MLKAINEKLWLKDKDSYAEYIDWPDGTCPAGAGDSGKVQALLRVLEPYGIKEIAQSGVLAIGRGSKSITERVFKN